MFSDPTFVTKKDETYGKMLIINLTNIIFSFASSPTMHILTEILTMFNVSHPLPIDTI